MWVIAFEYQFRVSESILYQKLLLLAFNIDYKYAFSPWEHVPLKLSLNLLQKVVQKIRQKMLLIFTIFCYIHVRIFFLRHLITKKMAIILLYLLYFFTKKYHVARSIKFVKHFEQCFPIMTRV